MLPSTDPYPNGFRSSTCMHLKLNFEYTHRVVSSRNYRGFYCNTNSYRHETSFLPSNRGTDTDERRAESQVGVKCQRKERKGYILSSR
ncbi:uncharacterized protein LOC143152171 isoform X2 [Ptiloglossa arizonensis]